MAVHFNHRIRVFTAALLLSGCGIYDDFNTVTSVDLGNPEPQLVANGIIAPNQPLEIVLTESQPIEEKSEFASVTGADILLTTGNSQPIRLQENDGVYFLENFRYQPATDYQFTISADGFDPVTIQETSPSPVPIKEVNTEFRLSGSVFSGPLLNIIFDLNFRDPEGETYYMLEMSLREDLFGSRDWIPITFNSTNFSLAEDALLEDPLNQGSEQFYNGGAIFSDDLFEGEDESIEMSFERGFNSFANNESTRFRVRLYTISKTLYEYYRTANVQKLIRENPYAEPIEVISNVDGGFGVIGSYSLDEEFLTLPLPSNPEDL